MTDPTPSAAIRDVVARADRRSRARGALRAMARLAPVLAAGVLGVALAGRWLGWPPIVAPTALGGVSVALLAYYLVARRGRATSDSIAARVDADASLAGELRSAHWFASVSTHDAWTAFHLQHAARRAAGVDWAALYPPVRAARSWIAAGACAAAVIALSISVPARPAPGTVIVDGVAIEADQLPLELRRKLEALIARMEEGKATAAETAASLDQLKELMANFDPELQKKLEAMLQKMPLEDAPKGKTIDADELAERAKTADSGKDLPEDVRWALEDLAARLANSAADQRQTNPNNPSASETGEKGLGSEQAQAEMGTAQASMQMVKEAAADPGASQMMMGGGAMGGDSRPGAGGNNGAEAGAADALLIAKALKKELVEAAHDNPGEHVDKDEDIRRKTEQGKSSMGFTRVAPQATIERSRADAPPAVPEARRELLQRYFIRR